MSVTVQVPRNTSIAAPGATVFPYDFTVLSKSDLVVVVDGVIQVVDVTFSVDGIGEETGGNITLFTPCAGNEKVLRFRSMLFQRLTDFQNLGDLRSNTLNNDQDAPILMLQQLLLETLHSILDPDGSGEFVWDALGQRIINVGDATHPQDAVNLRTLETVLVEGPTGPGSGVTPLYFEFVGDGTTVDFLMEGAEVDDPLFYDTALEMVAAGASDFAAQRPGVDFSIQPGNSSTSRVLRFVTPPANNARGFTVLRGYARATAIEYVATLRIPTYAISGTAQEIDSTHNFGLGETTNNSPVSITLRANTGAAIDFRTGDYGSLTQVGNGTVTVLATGITLVVPTGFQAKTRAKGATITFRCSFADTNTWYLSGDLLASASSPDLVVIQLHDRVALSGTNIAASVLRGQFTMPFGMLLQPIASGGVFADLMVAQAAGALVTFDVNRNGTSIISTKLTFDNSEKTTQTAATPAVYTAGGDVLAAGDVITWDVDQIGTALAKGGAVYLVGVRA